MIGRTGKRHPSDLTDDEWNHIATLLPAPEWRKRKLGVDAGGAECDLLHGAFGRRMAHVSEGLPAAGRLSTARFRRFVRPMLFPAIHSIAPMMDRECAGRTSGLSVRTVPWL